MRLPHEKGLLPESEIYDEAPSERANRLLYFIRRAGHYFCEQNYITEKVNGNGFVLYYVVKGKMRLSVHGNEAVICEGELCFINGHEPYRYQALEPLEFLWILMDGANTESFCSEIYMEYGLEIQLEQVVWVSSQMRQILTLLQDNGRIDEVQASKMLHELLCSMLYTSRPAGDEVMPISSDPQIDAVKRYFREHLNEEVSTEELAKEFHLSISQLNRKFREHTGQSPHEYLTNLRINRAKILLKDSQMTIAEIAGEVGYAYDTSLAAAFRRKMGMSPREFRNLSI